MNTPKNLAASVRARLLNHARNTGADYGIILTKYALERFLYRLSQSRWGDGFLLKGALLFDLWFDQSLRPTRDIDLLGFGSSDVDDIAALFREVCAITDEDGIHFDASTVRASEIRKEANYAGVRVTLVGILHGARCAVQIDVGFGDAVTPEPGKMHYPVLFEDMAAPLMRVYPVYTVVAEKYHAIVSLGMVNTRMKDYFDLWILAMNVTFDPVVLQRALANTFTRRETAMPQEIPIGLSPSFAQDVNKISQWKAFLGKNRLQAPALEEITNELRQLFRPPMRS